MMNCFIKAAINCIIMNRENLIDFFSSYKNYALILTLDIGVSVMFPKGKRKFLLSTCTENILLSSTCISLFS